MVTIILCFALRVQNLFLLAHHQQFRKNFNIRSNFIKLNSKAMSFSDKCNLSNCTCWYQFYYCIIYKSYAINIEIQHSTKHLGKSRVLQVVTHCSRLRRHLKGLSGSCCRCLPLTLQTNLFAITIFFSDDLLLLLHCEGCCSVKLPSLAFYSLTLSLYLSQMVMLFNMQ